MHNFVETFTITFRTGFPLKSQNENSAPESEKSAPIFVPCWASNCEYDSNTRQCKTTYNVTCLSIVTTIAIALLNINADKQECNSSITSAYHLTHH